MLPRRLDKKPITTAVLLCVALGAPPLARAVSSSTPAISGIVAGTWQRADGAYTGDTSRGGKFNGQLDLFANLPMGPGGWTMEVKAGTTPRPGDVSNTFPEANGLAGETLDQNGDGRIAVTQLYYQSDFGPGQATAGLIFPPGFLDTNDIADDEYRQFVGTSFVNNATLAMPTYVIGGVYSGNLWSNIGYTALLSSTADLYQNSYGNLFDFGGNGHGVFGAFEANWKASGLKGNVGVWVNTDDSFTTNPFSSSSTFDAAAYAQQTSLTQSSQNDYGVYANIGGDLWKPGLAWNMRVGWANPKVSAAANFIAGELAYDTEANLFGASRPLTLGLGLARTGASSHIVGPHASMIQAEAYARFHLSKRVTITPDVQWIRHSQFDPNDTSTWVETIRLAAEF